MDKESWDFSLEGCEDVGLFGGSKFLTADVGDGTCKRCFLLSTVTHHDGFLKLGYILKKSDVESRRCCHFLGCISNGCDFQDGTGRCHKLEITVKISCHTVGGTLLHDGSTNDRLTFCIHYGTFNRNLILTENYWYAEQHTK